MPGTSNTWTFAAAEGDINNDGFVDVVFGNYFQPNQQCLANGSGGFTCTDLAGKEYGTSGAEVVPLRASGQ
jgi:hypothetical protein